MNLIVSGGRFALVGIVVTLIHVIVVAGLIEWRGLHPGVANGIAFMVANFVSYGANTCWSFGARIRMDNWRRFVFVSLAAWMMTVIIASSVEAAGAHYLFGVALVVLLVPMLTFVAHQKFTYRRHSESV